MQFFHTGINDISNDNSTLGVHGLHFGLFSAKSVRLEIVVRTLRGG